MKSSFRIFMLAVLAVFANHSYAACGLDTIEGSWGTLINAYAYSEQLPFSIIARIKFDGQGGLSAKLKGGAFGKVASVTGSGTYKLGSNCQGIISLETEGRPDRIDFVVTGTPDAPSTLFMLNNRDDETTATGVMQRIDL